MFGSIGMPELIVILAVVLLIFGPTRLPDLGKSLGQAIQGLKKAINDPDRTNGERSESSGEPRESYKS